MCLKNKITQIYIKLTKNINAKITSREDSGYIAECREIPVITQGQTLDEVTKN